MELFKENLLLLYSVPIYAILIGLEMVMSYFHNKHYYSIKETITNVYLSCLNMGLDIIVRVVCLFVLDYFYSFHILEIEDSKIVYWFMLFIFQDLAFYTLHYFDHKIRLFWAVHVTHHSSDEFNLTVGFRSSVFQPLYRFIYFIPLSLLGFKSMDIMFMYAATQIYGILIHTQYIKKLGFLEHILATPSHHRVHHGSNVKYLDKNMGMVLIIWDKLFGTFVEEDEEEPVQYGLTSPLDKPHDPVNIVFHEWKEIANDVKKDISFFDKVRYIFNPPGWSHDGSRKTSKELQAELEADTIQQEDSETSPSLIG